MSHAREKAGSFISADADPFETATFHWTAPPICGNLAYARRIATHKAATGGGGKKRKRANREIGDPGASDEPRT
ncbi:MAG: hypothetical protein D8M59_08205 [Planctomycetes bacterium]|nr:hypothetical protein [Planctomycetota bacterium]